MESEQPMNDWDDINACYRRPYIPDLTQPRDVCNKTPHISTRRQAIAAIRAEQDAIFATRDETRGTHEASVRFCADVIIDKGERLMSQWKADLPMDPEEFLDIANWGTVALLIQRGQWTLPWEDE